MAKKDRSEQYKDFDHMLPQGARSRFDKAIKFLDNVDDAIPDDALAGEASVWRQCIRDLEQATANLNELMAYRKMMGID